MPWHFRQKCKLRHKTNFLYNINISSGNTENYTNCSKLYNSTARIAHTTRLPNLRFWQHFSMVVQRNNCWVLYTPLLGVIGYSRLGLGFSGSWFSGFFAPAWHCLGFWVAQVLTTRDSMKAVSPKTIAEQQAREKYHGLNRVDLNSKLKHFYSMLCFIRMLLFYRKRFKQKITSCYSVLLYKTPRTN